MTSLYTGTIIEESLEDTSILKDFQILNSRVTDDPDPADRWHLHRVAGTTEQIEKLATVLKPAKWYAHFWHNDDMIVVFHDKIFEQKISDQSTWQPTIEYGLSIGIPKEQLDFLVD